eukprot:3186549-Pyramimonas_sp.AAC.1
MQINLVEQPCSHDSQCYVAPLCPLSALAMPAQIMPSKLCRFPCSLACATPRVSRDARIGSNHLQIRVPTSSEFSASCPHVLNDECTRMIMMR